MLTLALCSAIALIAGDQPSANGTPLASSRSAIFARDPEPVPVPSAAAKPDTAHPAFEKLATQLLVLQARASHADSQVFALVDTVRRLRLDSIRGDSLARRSALSMAALSDSLARFRLHDSTSIELDTTIPSDSTLRPEAARFRAVLAQAALRSGHSVRTMPERSGYRTGKLLRIDLRRQKDSTWIRLVLKAPTDSLVVDRSGRTSDREESDLLQREAARALFGPVGVPPEPSDGVSFGVRAAILVSALVASLIVVFSL